MKLKTMTLLLLTITLGSCATAQTTAKIDTTEQDKTVTKEFHIKDFHGISASNVITIHFTQTNKYSMRVECTPKELELLKMSVRDGILTLGRKNNDRKRNKNSTRVHIYMEAPTLSSLDLPGVCNFETESLKTEDFSVNASGVSKVIIGLLNCKDLVYNQSGVGKSTVHIKAHDVTLNLSGVSECTSDIASEKLSIHDSGTSKSNIRFKGESVRIAASGTSTNVLNVDCQKLYARNSGVGRIILKGNADETEIHSSGVSKIDTSELNKY